MPMEENSGCSEFFVGKASVRVEVQSSDSLSSSSKMCSRAPKGKNEEERWWQTS